MMLMNRVKSYVFSKHQKHCFIRLLSSNSISQPKSNNSESSSPSDKIFNNQKTSTFNTSDICLEPTQIKSLNILQRIETFEKQGSVFKNLFLGFSDTDLLNFPFLLKSRQEYLDMTEQYEMIRQTWNKIKKDDETLNLLKYDSLYELSVSEMMVIFEAIGASVEKNLPFATKEDKENRFEKRLSKTFNIETGKSRFDIGESALQSFHDIREAIQTVIPLIEKNSIVYYALSRSSNANVKTLVEKKPKIAFAFDEDNPERTDININKWSSEARLAYDFNSWVINGQKNRIINQEYSHYLIFSKTNDFPETQKMIKLDNDVGIVALLVPSNQVTIEHDCFDYFAIEHQKIKFDYIEVMRDSCEVINASRDISEYSNVKGCGQLAVSAFILGLLKQLQKNTYSHLVNHRLGLTECELIQYKLYQSTCKIYALESMIYLTAAMFDSFEKGINLGGESITAKTMAVEYAQDVIGELRSLFGSRYSFSSTVYDLIYYLDSFLNSSLHNRMYLGQEAIKHYKMFQEVTLNRLLFIPRVTINSVKHYLKQRKLRNNQTILSREMTKYIHHNLHPACDWIEHCLNLLQFSMNYLYTLNQEKIYEKHFDLNRIITMAMDIHMMISCLSRANHALCYGFRNGHTEKEICLAICKETFLKHLQIFESIDKRVMADNDDFVRNIFEINLQERGYFPKLFEV